MRWVIASLAASLVLSAGAQGASSPGVVRVAKPEFPPPIARFTPGGGLRLHLVSTTLREPALTYSEAFLIPYGVPMILDGRRAQQSALQPGTALIRYGASLIAAFGPRENLKYAYDLRSFGFPPKSIAPHAYGPQEVVWARQVGRLLIVQTSHLGYASDSGNRNGYLTAIDLDTRKVRWRSPSLVANARNFVVARGMIISGYGFTAEKDWLYMTDVKTGRVRDRLALPSMAEQIERRGDRLVVQCYDAVVRVRLT